MSKTKSQSGAEAHAQAEKMAGAFEDVISAGKDTIENVVKAGADVASQQCDQAFAFGKEGMDATAKAYGEFASMGKENVEALVTAGSKVVQGGEKFNAELFDFAKSSLDDYFAMTRSMMGVKNFKDAVDLQADYMRKSYEGYIAQGSKFGALGMEIAQAAAEPVASRFAASFEKVAKTKAA